jgi:hypothetical protein
MIDYSTFAFSRTGEPCGRAPGVAGAGKTRGEHWGSRASRMDCATLGDLGRRGDAAGAGHDEESISGPTEPADKTGSRPGGRQSPGWRAAATGGRVR